MYTGRGLGRHEQVCYGYAVAVDIRIMGDVIMYELVLAWKSWSFYHSIHSAVTVIAVPGASMTWDHSTMSNSQSPVS